MMAMDSCGQVNGGWKGPIFFYTLSLYKYPPRVIYEVVFFLFHFICVVMECLESFQWCHSVKS